MSNTKPQANKTIDEIKEATKRFCRTDESADNLANYISALITEARIDESSHTVYDGVGVSFVTGSLALGFESISQVDRLAQLKEKL